MQVIVAIVAFLWAHSMLNALRRADRAEEIAILEQRELDRQAELEEGARQLLDVHVRLANGDFQARAPNMRNPLLWSVGNSLNLLIARLSRTAGAEMMLRREEEEARRLANTIRLARNGRQPSWPVPTGVPLDLVLEALSNRRLTIGGALSEPGARQANPPHNLVSQPPPEPPADSGYELPDWLRPQS
jgi:hypothetical protein